jgi:dihydrofolate reductase
VADLVYSSIASLDGYVADRHGNFDWAAPDPDVHAFVNDLERRIGTYLYGRRMYEVMSAWEDMDEAADPSPVMQDYAAIWQAADKIVYSTTLPTVTGRRTTLERRFDAAAVAELKRRADRPFSVGGPGLAAHALRAGLVDELHWFVVPAVVGGGTPFLPPEVHLTLDLVDEHRFGDGTVHLHYRVNS